MHTAAKYEKNPPYGCEAIAKRKCGSGRVASPIYKQVSPVGRLIIENYERVQFSLTLVLVEMLYVTLVLKVLYIVQLI